VEKALSESFVLPASLKSYSFGSVIYSSVGHRASGWQTHFPDSFTLDFTPQTPIMIEVDYSSPETLGVDRIANACAAFSKNRAINSIIIDAGTCVTIDLIEAGGIFRGGSIAPGLTMRYKSLNTFTAKLPLVEPTNPTIPGKSTEESINAGVLLGMIHELNSWVDFYNNKYEKLCVWLTGGDAHHFAKAFKSSIFADSNLTLVGLHEVLVYNQK
jgi:type III pantothenate kinase